METLENWLKKVYQAGGDRDTLDSLYDQWAREYDQHIWASGNPYIAIAATLTGRYVADNTARILDVGCGTGNMAQILHQTGFDNIEGLDPSEGMLAIARTKQIYRQLYPLALSAQVDLPDESYDAVVAAGVLTHGHAPPESLDGILNLVKPAGVIIFSLSNIALKEQGFEEKMAQLSEQGRWTRIDRSRLFRTYPFSEQEAHLRHRVYVYKKFTD